MRGRRPQGVRQRRSGELAGHLVQGGIEAEGVVARQQVDEVPGEKVAVLEALGGAGEDDFGVGPAISLLGAAIDGAPGLVEGGEGWKGFGWRQG